MQITRSSLATAAGPGEWFSGTVYFDTLATPSAASRLSAANVHFSPGARTAWHTHSNGQTIYVTEGLGLCQRRDDELAFPCAVALDFPMLDRAAAAGSKMLAEGCDAFGTGALDPDEAPAVGMVTRHRRHLDDLAAKRVRYIEGLAVGKTDTVAKLADVIDGEPLNHGARR